MEWKYDKALNGLYFRDNIIWFSGFLGKQYYVDENDKSRSLKLSNYYLNYSLDSINSMGFFKIERVSCEDKKIEDIELLIKSMTIKYSKNYILKILEYFNKLNGINVDEDAMNNNPTYIKRLDDEEDFVQYRCNIVQVESSIILNNNDTWVVFIGFYIDYIKLRSIEIRECGSIYNLKKIVNAIIEAFVKEVFAHLKTSQYS